MLVGNDQISRLCKLVTKLGVITYREAKIALGFRSMSEIQKYSRMDAALLIDQLESIPDEQKERPTQSYSPELPAQTEIAPKLSVLAAETVITLGEAMPGMTIRFLGQRPHCLVIAKTAMAIKFEMEDGTEIKAIATQNYWSAKVEVLK